MVIPDEVSKNASMNDGIVPLIIYGSVPKAEKTIQDNATARNPSLVFTVSKATFLEMPKKMTDNQI